MVRTAPRSKVPPGRQAARGKPGPPAEGPRAGKSAKVERPRGPKPAKAERPRPAKPAKVERSRGAAKAERPGVAKAERSRGAKPAKDERSRGTRPAKAEPPRPAMSARASDGPRRAKPARAEKGLWLYGRHAVEAALANPSRSCHRLLATPEALAKLGAAARRPGLEVQTVERAELDRRFGADAAHQGLALSVAPLPSLDLRRACAPEAGRNLVLALDQVIDPHNLGAILRSAAAFEVRAVLVPQRRSAPFSGAAAKAASGALDVVPVVEVVNLARALDELAELGYWRVALDGQAAQTLDEVPDAQNLVLVLGAEGAGLRRLVAEHCDLAARLPVAPQMESLNVSVACGIALYALARRGAD